MTGSARVTPMPKNNNGPWRSLSLRPPPAPRRFEERVAPCLACHGERGQSETENTPLARRPAGRPYTLIQLFMFREKLRAFDIMNEMAKAAERRRSSHLLRLYRQAAKKPPPADCRRFPRGCSAGRRRCSSIAAITATTRIFPARKNVPGRIANQREDYLAKTLAEIQGQQPPPATTHRWPT